QPASCSAAAARPIPLPAPVTTATGYYRTYSSGFWLIYFSREHLMAHYDAVFEGGGAKGIAFVGALEVLEQHGHTLRRFIGTSAGAITATLLAAGYSTAEMMAAIMEKQPDGT